MVSVIPLLRVIDGTNPQFAARRTSMRRTASPEGLDLSQIIGVCFGMPKQTPIIWDKSKPSGDAVRLMDVRRAANCGFVPSITLSKGITETMDWYRKYKETVGERYNAFTERRLMPND